MHPQIQQILKLEKDPKYDILWLLQRYEKFILTYNDRDDIEGVIQLQKFKIRLAIQLINTHFFKKAYNYLNNARMILLTAELNEQFPFLYNRVLLGLLKCTVYLKLVSESEIIAKNWIDPNFIEEMKLYKELKYQSNLTYWAYKLNYIMYIGCLLAVIPNIFNLLYGVEYLILIRYIGLGVVVIGYIYKKLNLDIVSIDPLEFFVRENTFRSRLNEQYGWNLGKQPELE